MHKFNMVKKANINIFFFMTSKAEMCVCISSGSMTNALRKCKLYPGKKVMAAVFLLSTNALRPSSDFRPVRGWMIKCNWNRIYSAKHHNIFWCPLRLRRSMGRAQICGCHLTDLFYFACSGHGLKASWWILCLIFIIFMCSVFYGLSYFFPLTNSKFFVIELKLWCIGGCKILMIVVSLVVSVWRRRTRRRGF